jgi:hypothetical protein
VGEDPSGQALVLQVENLAQRGAVSCSWKFVSSLYPVGSWFAIKEPSVSLGRMTGLPEIQVTVPTDIIELPETADIEWRFASPVS